MSQLMDEEQQYFEFTTTLFSKKICARNLYICLCFVGAHPFQTHLGERSVYVLIFSVKLRS